MIRFATVCDDSSDQLFSQRIVQDLFCIIETLNGMINIESYIVSSVHVVIDCEYSVSKKVKSRNGLVSTNVNNFLSTFPPRVVIKHVLSIPIP